MRPGRVVEIRVSPKDCMAVVDLVQAAGVTTVGMSFARVVSTALTVALNTFKEQQAIPEREGFEYAEMMRPFDDQPHVRARRAALGRQPPEAPAVVLKAPPSTDIKRKQVRFEELRFKVRADPVNVSQAELEEYLALQGDMIAAGVV